MVLDAHLMFCNVQHEPARFPAFQERSSFVQDALVRPEKYLTVTDMLDEINLNYCLLF